MKCKDVKWEMQDWLFFQLEINQLLKFMDQLFWL
jgi:hypothetical protein